MEYVHHENYSNVRAVSGLLVGPKDICPVLRYYSYAYILRTYAYQRVRNISFAEKFDVLTK